MSILNPENYGIPLRQRLIEQTTKKLLSTFEPPKTWKYKNFEGWSRTLVAYKKSVYHSW